jgi:hypothetical protein
MSTDSDMTGAAAEAVAAPLDLLLTDAAPIVEAFLTANRSPG